MRTRESNHQSVRQSCDSSGHTAGAVADTHTYRSTASIPERLTGFCVCVYCMLELWKALHIQSQPLSPQVSPQRVAGMRTSGHLRRDTSTVPTFHRMSHQLCGSSPYPKRCSTFHKSVLPLPSEHVHLPLGCQPGHVTTTDIRCPA